MVLNPMDALSLAAAIVAFVDFSSKLVSKGCHIYQSADGALSENLEVETIASDLSRLNTRLRRRDKLGCLTNEEQTLEDMSNECTKIADELLGRLEKLKVAKEAKHRKWKSFRQALKTVWNKKDLDDLSARLSAFRDELQFHILLSLRENNDLLGMQQSDRFDRVDDATKDLLQALVDNRAVFTDTLKSQSLVITRLHNETKSYITFEADKTRQDIIHAIQTFQLANQGGVLSRRRQSTPQATITDSRIEDTILDTLRFPTMYDRYDGIEDAHTNTFDWVLQDPGSTNVPWDSFSQWLSKGEGIYWVSGKAGSGKSTLMRYIQNDSRTKVLLRDWTGPSEELAIAGFFFWISGTPDQASQVGLLRSLLFELLSQRRHLIQTVLPDAWLEIKSSWLTFGQGKPYSWTLAKVTKAFLSLFSQDLGHVFLLIDGLDEYDGEPTETIKLLRSVISPKVKVCLSSRPWKVFEEAFANDPKLRLQDLTFQDIEQYVNDQLLNNEKMKKLCLVQPEEAPKLVNEIVQKADGVFLWVKLVVRSLLNGLMNGDRVSYLRKRLEQVPKELEHLYKYMLTKIEEIYFEEAFWIFSCVQLSFRRRGIGILESQSICAVALSFALEEKDFALSAPIKTLTKEETVRRVDWIDGRLKVCCAGLLELSNSIERVSNDVALHKLGNRAVQYIHRTARDFLESEEARHTPMARLGSNTYNAPSMLLQSNVLYLKCCSERDEKRREYEMQYDLTTLVTWSMVLTLQIEQGGDDEAPLLDELHKTLCDFIDPPVNWADFVDMDYGRAVEWYDDFLSLAIVWGLNLYLAKKLGEGRATLKAKRGKPYLDYALRLIYGRYSDRWNLKTIQLLLEHGGDPNQRFNDNPRWQEKAKNTTPWQAVLGTLWALKHSCGDLTVRERPSIFVRTSLLEMLLNYGANPHASVMIGDTKYSASTIIAEALSESPADAARIQKLLREKKLKHEKRRRGVFRGAISQLKDKFAFSK